MQQMGVAQKTVGFNPWSETYQTGGPKLQVPTFGTGTQPAQTSPQPRAKPQPVNIPQQRRFQAQEPGPLQPPLDLSTLHVRDRHQQLGGLRGTDTGTTGTIGSNFFGGGGGTGVQPTTPQFTQVRNPNPIGTVFSDEDAKTDTDVRTGGPTVHPAAAARDR